MRAGCQSKKLSHFLQSNFFSYKMRDSYGGWVAQLVEQRIENPRVGGSIPSPATRNYPV